MSELLDWLRTAAEAHPRTIGELQPLVDRSEALLLGPLTDVERALVLDRRARLRANANDGAGYFRVDALGAAELYQGLGLWRQAASSYVQAANGHAQAGDLSACLDLVVRAVLAAQVASSSSGQPGGQPGGQRDEQGLDTGSLTLLDAGALAESGPELDARIHNQLGILGYQMLAYDQAAQMYRAGLEAGPSGTAVRQQPYLLHNLVEALVLRARLPDGTLGADERAALLREAERVARTLVAGGHGPVWTRVDGPRLLADVLCELGDPLAAWEVLQAVEDDVGREPALGQAPALWLVRGRCLRRLGRSEEALVELDDVVEVLERTSVVEYVLALQERSLAREDAGDLEGAWQDSARAAAQLWQRHRQQVGSLFDLVWSRAGFEGERRQLEALADTLSRATAVDALTGLLNRRGLEKVLSEVDPPDTVAMLVVDVDHFKVVNDTFGHAVGDDVLRLVAQVLTDQLPAGAWVARWGGEEFVVLMAGGPSSRSRDELAADAAAFAEVLRIAVESCHRQERPWTPTVSIGVALGRARWWREILQAADAAMFEAKRTGRNRVVLA